MFIVPRLPNRMLTDFALPSCIYSNFSVVCFFNMSRIPSLCLNNQQPDTGNNYNEIWVSISDHGLVIDDYIVWKLLEKRKYLLLTGASAVGKPIWYHFSHVHPP